MGHCSSLRDRVYCAPLPRGEGTTRFVPPLRCWQTLAGGRLCLFLLGKYRCCCPLKVPKCGKLPRALVRMLTRDTVSGGAHIKIIPFQPHAVMPAPGTIERGTAKRPGDAVIDDRLLLAHQLPRFWKPPRSGGGGRNVALQGQEVSVVLRI